jgi:hypothetical protein
MKTPLRAHSDTPFVVGKDEYASHAASSLFNIPIENRWAGKDCAEAW